MAKHVTSRSTEPPAPTPPKVVGGYETLDGEEAARYLAVGARLVSVVKRYPDQLFKAGKRYRFLESKVELDALLARNTEGA